MELLDNYLKYRQYKPQYKDWKNNKDDIEAKRLAYIEKHGVSEEQKQLDIKRARAVLNAVDVMDEYSQTRAEDMEMVTQSAKAPILSLTSYLGMGLGALFAAKSKSGKALYQKLAKNSDSLSVAPLMAIPMVFSLGLNMLVSPLLIAWGTKKEIGASRSGRHEAMNKELSSAKQFAILTDEQQKQRDEIAKTINIDTKKAKKAVNANKGGIGIIKSLKLIFAKDKAFEKSNAEFNKKVEEDLAKFDTVKLSEKDLQEAKKDKQLVSNIVEKIDIASQDYAENIELATTVINTAALGSGGLLGFLTSKVLKNVKFKNPASKTAISFATGAIATLALTIFSTKIQKQGSRVARYKVKQDFMNNPEKLLYVDDEAAKNEDSSKFKKRTEKPGFFKFMINIFKDNAEYNRYLKSENVVHQQQRKAQEQIELTPEQEKRAKQLQNNVFKMFNKVDEKSQTYSESTEALGETVQSIASLALSIPLMFGMFKGMDKAARNVDNNAISAVTNMLKPVIKYMALTLLPVTLITAYVTKEQKNASRVADMLAINEMDDPRHFADYSNAQTEFKGVSEQSEQKPEVPKSKYIL